MRGLCSELLEMWSSVRPNVRYTGLPHLKEVDRVCSCSLFLRVIIFESFDVFF